MLLHVPQDPTVTLKVWFKVGSQDDPAGKQGLALLTGHLISEASTTRHDYDLILEKLYPLASGYSIRVDREMTVLTGRTHRDNLDGFYGLFTDAYLRPAFKQQDFDRLKSNTLNFLKNTLRYQSDEELAKATLYGFVFEGTPYAHPPEGTVKSVESITLEDVKAFYRRHYSASNARVALGGGYDPELVARFEATLDELPPGAPEPTPAPEPPAIEGIEVLLVSKPGADASISFGFPIDVQRGQQDFYALWLANSWLGEHRNSSSRLYQVIREARGMNYGDYSYIEAFPGGGRRSVPPTHVARRGQIFEVWIRTLPNADAHFALRAAMRELKHLVDEGLSEEQFQLTRDFLAKYCLHYAETTSARLGYALDDRFYGIDDHLAQFRSAMGELTREQVNTAVRKHLRYGDLKIAVVSGDADRLRAALIADSPSPKTYERAKPEAIVVEDKEIAVFRMRVAESAVRVVSVDSVLDE